MSLKYMVMAWNTPLKVALRKLALLKLADNANDEGECWPSYQTIAEQCGMDRSTAIRHIAELERGGYLTKEERVGGRNYNKSNLFILLKSACGTRLGGGTAPLVGTQLTGGTAPLGGGSLPLGGGSLPLGGGTAPPDPVIEPVSESVKELKEPLSGSPDDAATEAVRVVIDYMNRATGSKYHASTKSHAQNIRARLSEGHTVADLCLVIDTKVVEWGQDKKMAQYLRPQTLFSTGKFDGYLRATTATGQQYSATTARNIEMMQHWEIPA